MSRLIVMAVVLVVTVAGALLWGNYIKNESVKLEDIAKEAIADVEREDYERAVTMVDKIYEIWSEKEKLWSMAIDHSVLHNIEMHCLRAREYIVNQEKSHALAELESMRLFIEEMRKTNEFSTMNIL